MLYIHAKIESKIFEKVHDFRRMDYYIRSHTRTLDSSFKFQHLNFMQLQLRALCRSMALKLSKNKLKNIFYGVHTHIAFSMHAHKTEWCKEQSHFFFHSGAQCDFLWIMFTFFVCVAVDTHTESAFYHFKNLNFCSNLTNAPHWKTECYSGSNIIYSNSCGTHRVDAQRRRPHTLSYALKCERARRALSVYLVRH